MLKVSANLVCNGKMFFKFERRGRKVRTSERSTPTVMLLVALRTESIVRKYIMRNGGKLK